MGFKLSKLSSAKWFLEKEFAKEELTGISDLSSSDEKELSSLLNAKQDEGYALYLVLDENDKKRIKAAYLQFKNLPGYKNSLNDFKSALEEIILDKFITKIEQIVNRPEQKLINKIIEDLRKKSSAKDEFSMPKKIHCAAALLNYLKNNKLELNSLIQDDILNNQYYGFVFRRFSDYVNEYNYSIRAPKSKNIIEPKFHTANSEELKNRYLSKSGPYSFIYCNYENSPRIYYIDSNNKNIEIDISGLQDNNKVELEEAIKDRNLSKLKLLLGDLFPKDEKLELAKRSYAESLSGINTFDYIRSKIGSITSLGSSNKSKGEKERLKVKREKINTEYYSQGVPDSQVDNLKTSLVLANATAAEHGFMPYEKRKIDFEFWWGGDEPNSKNLQKKKNDLYILQLSDDKVQAIYYVDTSKSEPVPLNLLDGEDDALHQLGIDLLYILSRRLEKKYNPSTYVQRLCLKYEDRWDKKLDKVSDIDTDIINFIADATGHIPSSELRNQWLERAEIIEKIKNFNFENLDKTMKERYENIFRIIKKIVELPANYLSTADSIVPRYKCKSIIEKMELLSNNNALDLDYFRSSYKLYECVDSLPDDEEMQKCQDNNPRFYFVPKTSEIAYVDALNVVRRSKLKWELKLGISPDSLKHIIARKSKEDGSVTLDSEEVFKYITSKVEDKNSFKMHTVNEELEEIIADEVATAKDVFKNLGMGALSIGLAMLLILVPGFNLVFYISATVALQFVPLAIECIASEAYADALKNLGMAAAMIGMVLFMSFVPGLNFLSLAAGGAAVIYITLAIASLSAAFYTGAAFNAASKNPEVKEANKALLDLKKEIKKLTHSEENPIEDDNYSVNGTPDPGTMPSM